MLFVDLKMRFKTNVISKDMCDISLNQLSYPKSMSSLPYIFQPYQQNCSSSSFSFLRPSLSFLCCFYWRRRWHPTPLLLPGKSHGWRSLVGCSPWGHEEGTPLHYSCLENPMNRGSWKAAVHGLLRVGHD